MSYAQMPPVSLVTSEKARALDGEAAAEWGLNPFALVEAAGRACAGVLVRAFPAFFERSAGSGPAVTVFAGSGNNAADALVMLRTLLLSGYADPARARVLIARRPDSGEQSPLTQSLLAIQKMNVPVTVWNAGQSGEIAARAGLIIDGVAGTGLRGAPRGPALEMIQAVNELRRAAGPSAPVVSIDVPSGNGGEWRPGMPILAADLTLAIEPQKLCLYTPAARTYGGRILQAGGIFPPALIGKYRDAELLSWQSAAARVPAVKRDAHKYERGLVEIRAGSPGAAGAATLAALGARAAGAGLVRLIVDDSLYPVAAPGASGVMVVPCGAEEEGRFRPDAALVGPGWGRGPARARLLEKYLPLEERGLPLVLDADAVYLSKDRVFHGNAILTPHAGEFAAYTGLSKDEILADPVPVLRRFAGEKNVHLLFKSHVLYIAAPDGRLGLIDGMNPVLAAGGSGDVLAGLCAAIAARWRAGAGRPFDGYVCACAAAALLLEAARAPAIASGFVDPARLAETAASIAGKAWLPAAAEPVPE